eukprot:6697907-Ditylum_brightwellii.AAC.1
MRCELCIKTPRANARVRPVYMDRPEEFCAKFAETESVMPCGQFVCRNSSGSASSTVITSRQCELDLSTSVYTILTWMYVAV